jgi:hypothetical protein
MSLKHISRRILAAVMLVALLVATTPALALALSLQDSQNSMDCCKDGLCPMHQHKSDGEPLCGSNGSSTPIETSMRACDSTPNLALGIVPFVLIAPMPVGAVTLSIEVQVSRTSDVQPVVSTPPTPPPRALLS